MRLKPPKFIRRLMPSLVWEIESEDSVYLTFDDGPTPGVTEWILATLAKHKAKATFFLLGRNVELYPELYQRILDGGHKVANHTYSHQKGWKISLEDYAQDVELAAGFISSTLFRPPYGQITPSQARFLSQRYKLIMWDIISRDYSGQVSPEGCAHNVLKYMKAGSIVVFHDSEKSFANMCYALPRVLKRAREMGLKCSSISEAK